MKRKCNTSSTGVIKKSKSKPQNQPEPNLEAPTSTSNPVFHESDNVLHKEKQYQQIKRQSSELTGSTSKLAKLQNQSELHNIMPSETSTSSDDVSSQEIQTIASSEGIRSNEVQGIAWFTEKGFDKIFVFQKVKSAKMFEVTCTLCSPEKSLAVSMNSSYNLKSHLKSSHTSTHEQFQLKSTNVLVEDEAKNPMFNFLDDTGRAINEEQFERLILYYIIDVMAPFSVVEYESFKKLVLIGKHQNLRVPTRKTVVQSLIREYQILKNGQINEYSKIKYFCVTTDLWSSRRRGFLGVTIHWICTKTYARKRAALACRRIKGIHSSDVLAYHIDDILKSYHIPCKKVLKIITDGASNFKKAFKEHQLNITKDNDDDDEIDIVEITRILNENKDDNIFLSPHSSCASHSLCLTLTTDIKKKKKKTKKNKTSTKAKENIKFNRKFRRFRRNVLDPVLAKCTALFNKQQQSTKAADLIHAGLSRYLVTPCPTRWNSLYDSVVLVSELLIEKPAEMNKIFDLLELDHIQPDDHQVLKEYIQITESVADALDVFQGEEYMFFGVYAPTVCKLKEKVNSISGLKYCQLLQEAISKSINTRFPDAMVEDNLIASILHPLFKTYPLFDEHPELKSKLIQKISAELHPLLDRPNTKNESTRKRSDIKNQKKFKKLFDFDENTGFAGSSVELNTLATAEAVIHKYLASPITSFEVFDFFPEIGQLFIKYNTPLCSSAPCERLFSIAKQVLTAIRCRLLDNNFEIQLLLKANLFPSSKSNQDK